MSNIAIEIFWFIGIFRQHRKYFWERLKGTDWIWRRFCIAEYSEKLQNLSLWPSFNISKLNRLAFILKGMPSPSQASKCQRCMILISSSRPKNLKSSRSYWLTLTHGDLGSHVSTSTCIFQPSSFRFYQRKLNFAFKHFWFLINSACFMLQVVWHGSRIKMSNYFSKASAASNFLKHSIQPL